MTQPCFVIGLVIRVLWSARRRVGKMGNTSDGTIMKQKDSFMLFILVNIE